MSGPPDGPGDDLDPILRPQAQPRRAGEWPLTLVLGSALGALGVVAVGHFRPGTVLLSLAVLLGAGLRAALPTRTAGLLAVRSRAVDALLMGVLGLGMLVLALIVPETRG